ncbi:MAG: adenosine kinase [Treponema sp.]|nr:adenosine kinase [Treponema sp.]
MNTDSQFELFCIGNVMVDIFAQADTALMDRLGLTEAVQHVSSEEAEHIIRELGGKNDPAGNLVPDEKAGFIVCSGGGAANAAKIAALLGIQTGFTGCTGKDPLGAIFRREITASGAVPLLVPGTEKTGMCIILTSPGGETRIAAAPGAAAELSPEHIGEEAVKNAGIVILDGYLLDRQPLTRRVLALADQFGVPVALDVASVFRVQEKTEEILHYSRNYPLIIFMNEDEAIAFYQRIRKTGEKYESRGPREKTDWIIREICPVFQIITGSELFPIIAVKLGSRGAVIIAGGTIYRAETSPVVPRNSTGAGDAFCAAFLAGWVRKKSIAESAALGNRVAREVLNIPGTRIDGRKLARIQKSLHRL